MELERRVDIFSVSMLFLLDSDTRLERSVLLPLGVLAWLSDLA